MDEKNQFGQGILYTFTNYVYAFLLTNIYFVLTNGLFIFFFMTLEPSFSNILLYFLALIPTGPAVAALYYSMEKLVRTKELSPTHDFFYGFKKNIKDILSIWFPILLVYFILIVDLQYLRQTPTELNQILSIVIFVLIVLWTMLILNAVAISSRFKFRMRDIWKLSVYYSFMKVKNTVGNMLILFILAFITTITTDFLILFVSSFVFYLLALNTKEMLLDIETNFLKTSSKHTDQQLE
ncbi:YesL family protein [Metabacillus halosaccharovorans]|uniref:YesL family protein n=1 Tax=Metabacillus halosaccharovorans TaxID=930124 RepID=A0ABT3DFM6_9BACI|nr:YesL family protein [Metabacillus halosaccharovorans]MCV9885462.1 YesL family protein [Metabacillus halosaccharovorans]